MERTRLRNILVILFIIILLLFASWYAYDSFHSRRMAQDDVEEILKTSVHKPVEVPEPREQTEESPDEPTSEPAASEPVIEAAAAEPEKPAEPELIPRHKTGEHTVQKGESFSLITGFYWEDIFLWPDLYIRNSMRSDDPDLIYPDEIIEIYNRLGIGDEFTRRETDEILEAYLQVYRVYKKLGDKKNNSVWSLLWCAARYDHDFLEKYGDRIDPEDRAMAQKYIDEQGFLD